MPSYNDCLKTRGNSFFSSRLYGFHKRPFNVNINSDLDHICIVFYPSALRAFTHEFYDNLMKLDNVFDIFTTETKMVMSIFIMTCPNPLIDIKDDKCNDDAFRSRSNKIKMMVHLTSQTTIVKQGCNQVI